MMRIMRTVGVATLRNSPDRLIEKTRSHGVSGFAGGNSRLLCQPPQPNGFFHGRRNSKTSSFSSGTRHGPAETQVSESVYWTPSYNAGRVHFWTSGNRRTFQGSYRRINQKGCIAPLDAVSHRSQAERSSWKRHVFLQKHCMAKASFLCFIGERWPMLRVWCWSKGRSNFACGSHQAEVEVSRACFGPKEHAGIVRELQYRERGWRTYSLLNFLSNGARVSAKHGLACVGRAAQTKPSGSVEAKQLERGGTAPRVVDSLTENERLWFDSFPIQRDRPTLQNGTAELTLTGMGIAFPNAQPHSAAID